jgi:putative selenate reductase
MSELVPIPLDLQLHRAFLEYAREGKIFDLPRTKFFHPLPGLETSARCNGRLASTPLGPAAGPHTQLLQNIVLCWLGGARIIELKTVQILDDLDIPRPCIDSENVTFNVEWSQELRLEQSLREYVSAVMFLQILKASGLLGEDYPAQADDTIFDVSVGYNLDGLRSPRMRAWIAGMKDATPVIDELRSTLTGRFRAFRDLPFPTCVSDTVTLSTFHGCPPDEIEGIVTFLLTEMDLHVCVKMNPTLLGEQQVRYLLHDVLGYRDIEPAAEAFASDLQFDDAVQLIPRLDAVARAHGRNLSVKFSNTLSVRNNRGRFRGEAMYMSGPPLHVLAVNLAKHFREAVGAELPLSFSAGLTSKNIAETAAMNFVPVTTCSDLLKPAGYARLHRYMENLGDAMRADHAGTIPEFVLRHAGQGARAADAAVGELRNELLRLREHVDGAVLAPIAAWVDNAIPLRLRSWLGDRDTSLRTACNDIVQEFGRVADGLPSVVAAPFAAKLAALERSLVNAAGLLNMDVLVARATVDLRYRREQNRATPRKIGSRLALYDCINCDKCVQVCPNDANFVYEIAAADIAYENYRLLPDGGFVAVEGGTFKLKHRHQLANFADACNDCGNCDVFCPEDGAPNQAKPRFFGSLDSYRRHAGANGFCVHFEDRMKTIHGVILGKSYVLTCDDAADCARFEDADAEYVIQPSRHALLSWRAKSGPAAVPEQLDMLPYLEMKFLLDAVTDSRHVNYANAAGFRS